MGEDRLCDTCAEFPRFINDYGNVRETGIAPSCKTAGELMLSYREELTFDTEDEPELIPKPNDIDAFTYMQLRQARIAAFGIISDRDISIYERLAMYLEYARQIQKHLDTERDELIANVAKKFCSFDYRTNELGKLKDNTKMLEKKRLIKGLRCFFDDFPGMEVINPDWNIHVKRVSDVLDRLSEDKGLTELVREYHRRHSKLEQEYEQLAMYYVYRYMLDAVNDYDVLLKAKNAVIGILAVDIMAAANEALGVEADFTLRVDIAHLYSRQFMS